MNYYLFLSVLVVVSLGPRATAKDVFFHLRRTSIKEAPTEETKKKLSGDAELPLINSFVQMASKARTWTQWLRKLLKALRKWSHSHPPEVKLGKCLASYFNIKLPGVRRFEKVAGHNATLERQTGQNDRCWPHQVENCPASVNPTASNPLHFPTEFESPNESKLMEHPKVSKKRRISRATTKKGKRASHRSFSKGNSLWNTFLFPVQDFLREIRNRFSHYTGVLYRNDLAVCAWEYISKKFWMWVDSAPDSRFCS